MVVKEIDFNLYLSKDLQKTFKFKDSDGTDYDLSGATGVVLKLYKDIGSPLELIGTINVSLATVSFIFYAVTHTNELGSWEYIIEETTIDGVNLIGKGNLVVLDYVPFSRSIEAFIKNDLPNNLSIEADFINQKLLYWRLILQEAFEITDASLEIESAWPQLVNILLGKLVIYEALDLAAKGSYIQFMGGDYQTNSTSSGVAVKKIETGPANVEFFDMGLFTKNAFTTNGLFDNIKITLCGLSNKLKVKLPMCKGNIIPITPKVNRNPDWNYTTLTELMDGENNPVSQG